MVSMPYLYYLRFKSRLHNPVTISKCGTVKLCWRTLMAWRSKTSRLFITAYGGWSKFQSLIKIKFIEFNTIVISLMCYLSIYPY